MSPRTGRPKVINPKIVDIKVRLDDDTNKKLMEYCKECGITRAEAVRNGILLLLNKKK
ncbi:MAG: CopG family transcriptional regulator [Oscillospiraceae bacterium]